MYRIVMLPLDERPCNFDYPAMMPKADYELVLPPKEIMGDKKIPGDTERIAQWLLENVDGADAVILSLDALIYGGIVPSRLHHETEEVLIQKADILAELKKRNPRMKLYAFQLIMRCPDYSSSDEEPDYYEDYGAELHRYGRYIHLEQLEKLSAEDRADFQRLKEGIPSDHLSDFLDRRKKNLSVLMHDLAYVKSGTVDYFIIPQDDAAVYGFTSMDQMTVRQYLKANTLHRKTAMYPSADDTGLALLARAVAQLSGVKPRVYVHYASSQGGTTIPHCEDRILDETVNYHILAVGGIRVYSLLEADMLLAVNVGSAMFGNASDPGAVTAYDIERNLAAFVTQIEYALEMNKTVVVGDVAWLNRADEELTALLHREGLLLKIHGYAGWNTSSNTLGTAICQGLLYMIGGDDAGNRKFLLHRYYEDIGYMAFARGYITEHMLPGLGLDCRHVDGCDGEAARLVEEAIGAYMGEHYPSLAETVQQVNVRMPWRRMFEAEIKLKLADR